MANKKVEIPLYSDLLESYVLFQSDRNGNENFKRRILKGLDYTDEETEKIAEDPTIKFNEALKLRVFGNMGYSKKDAMSLARDNSIQIREGDGAIDTDTEYGDLSDFVGSPFSIVKVVEPKPERVIPRRIKRRGSNDEIVPINGENKKRQTMLDQFYGNPDAEKDREERFARLKSHIVEKEQKIITKDGQSKTIKIKTIEKYDKREEDTFELNLEGLRTKLERLSRAEQGDLSIYEAQAQKMINDDRLSLIEKYQEIAQNMEPKKANEFYTELEKQMDYLESPAGRRTLIQYIIDQDTEFVETNNYAYDSHKATQDNLKTLGKDGEKSQKAQISDDQKFLTKLGLRTMNVLISIRNHTFVPVNKAIGTLVVAPIHKKMFKVGRTTEVEKKNVDGYLIEPVDAQLEIAQQKSAGMFKNKPIHRYEARKDYFAKKVRRQILEKMQEKDPAYKNTDVRRVSVGSQIKLAILPRIYAVTKFQEGNKAILNAGLKDIENASEIRQHEIDSKRNDAASEQSRITELDKEIADLQLLLEHPENGKAVRMLKGEIQKRKDEKNIAKAKMKEAKEREVTSVATDAVSLAQHDRANKATITGVVHGAKWAGRIAAAKLVSRYLYKEVVDHYEKEKVGEEVTHVPEKKVTEKVLVQDPARAEVQESKLKDLMVSSDGKVHYNIDEATGKAVGNTISQNGTNIRGIAFQYNGKLYSANDGIKIANSADKGAPTFGQTFSPEMDTITAVQQALKDNNLGEFTREQVQEFITNGNLKNFSLWTSYKDSGTPMGWTVPKTPIIKWVEGSKHYEEVTKVVSPAHDVVTPIYKDVPVMKSVLNPAAVGAEIALGVGGLEQVNNALRFNRSQEDMENRNPATLDAMEKENEQKKKEKSKDKEQETENNVKEEKREKKYIASHRESNKSHVRNENYRSDYEGFTGIGGRTTFDKFLLKIKGQKGKGDFDSSYDERKYIPGLDNEVKPANPKAKNNKEKNQDEDDGFVIPNDDDLEL